jgi:hypothetical protein
MEDLSFSTLIVPVIALIVVAVLFLSLISKVGHGAAFKQLSVIVLVAGFLLNFAWELLQGPLYQGFVLDLRHIAFCALAAVSDAIMVLLLYYGFAFIYNAPFWVKGMNLQRALVLGLTGGLGAILVEKSYLSEEAWTYAPSMPVIPIVNVGLSPVLQFTILPVLTIYSGYFFFNKGKSRRTTELQKKLYD